MKTLIWKDTCIPKFIAALFTIAKIRKQPKCPSMSKWIKKVWSIHRMEYYSVIKKEWNLPICDNMHDSCGNYTKGNKSGKAKCHTILHVETKTQNKGKLIDAETDRWWPERGRGLWAGETGEGDQEGQTSSPSSSHMVMSNGHIMYITVTIVQGCQTHCHQGPHQPCGCFQRGECNFRTV